jgi:putative selenium metabolism hydrolase
MVMNLVSRIKAIRSEIIDFLRELIRTPSTSGDEEAIAKLIVAKMEELGYDHVEIDAVGNVIGVVENASRKTLLYNGHMDTVPPGGMKDPYSAHVLDGEPFGVPGEVVYGRGACDMKGALAAMTMAGGILKREAGFEGHLIITGSVLEEAVESLGSRHLVRNLRLRPDVAVVGEATNMDIAIGHRGVLYPEITVKGKSCHASAPHRGVNALYRMTDVIQEIQKIIPELPQHPFLGKMSMAINTISVIPGALNVVPERCTISVDTRTIPEFGAEDVINLLKKALGKLELDAEVKLMEKQEKCYTGYSECLKKDLPAFYTSPNDRYVQRARRIIAATLDREPSIKPWVFATDSACFSEIGASTFGFGPGDEKFAHTAGDHVRVDDVVDAAVVYAQLASKL